MTTDVLSLAAGPPFRLTWRSPVSLKTAEAGNGSLYGITAEGHLVALNGETGSQRWAATSRYLPRSIVRQGFRLFAYRAGEGLGVVDDQGTPQERLLLSFGASPTANMAHPIIDNNMIYCAVNRGLYGADQETGLQFAAVLSDVQPHSIGLIARNQLVTIDGKGLPTRYQVQGESINIVWTGANHGIEPGQTERPFIIAENHLVVGVGQDTVAYNLATGQIAWLLKNVPARAFALGSGIVFGAFNGAALWAVRLADGAILWRRQYLYTPGLHREYGLRLIGNHLYYGGVLQAEESLTHLLAVRASDGAFSWLSQGVALQWAGGLPATDGIRLFGYGGDHTGAYTPLRSTPQVTPERVTVAPTPLRGPAAGFGAGSVSLNLSSSVRISLAPYREVRGLGTRIMNDVNLGPGRHDTAWTPNSTGGFSDSNQFGYMLVDVSQSNGDMYTQAFLLPVNTFPDIVSHWGRSFVETMVYHKHVSGYPDQTFKPDNLITRAEVSTIIAKTLELEGPPTGFQTRFTDIGTHWARNHIMALEARNIIGGFQEPDGTYTFRPDLNMTRAQEARILVNAYQVTSAPPGFPTKFIDIHTHWAEADIKALEAGGYINGFQEVDGSFTYRPEQSLTRAELCTVVVRILSLWR